MEYAVTVFRAQRPAGRMNFKTSEDLPFVLKGGQSKEVALFNRIAAINRLNYLARKELPDFDIRVKSDEWIRCWELEMWKRFYQKDPKKVIDEDFCQNGAKVAIEMEKEVPIFNPAEHFEAIKSLSGTPLMPSLKEDFISKWFKKIIKRFKK